MSRPVLMIALALALAPGPLLADKTTVYKSTNADGTSVYSQVETRDAETRRVDGRDPAQAPAEAAPAEKSEAEVACENARTNLALYTSGKRLKRDKDGDGVLDDLTPEEIDEEKAMTERQVSAFCEPEPEG
jgi:hypothetical protein